MHYYKFNIKDWTRDTAHLSVEEEGVYRRLLDHYYESEKPIPEETQSVIRRLRLAGHEEALGIVLSEFFVLESDGYRHARCDKEIAAYHAKADANRRNGGNGGRPKKPKENPDGFQEEPTNNLNHKPLTTNQEPIDKSSCDQQAESPKGKRIPFNEIFEAYAQCLPGLPQLRIIDESRKAMIRSRWNADERFQTVDFWVRFFTHVSESDFLMGRTDRPWTGCSFDWLLKPANFRKIVEGNYTNA